MNDVDDIMAKVNAMERRQFAEEQTVVSDLNTALEKRIARLERKSSLMDKSIRSMFAIVTQLARRQEPEKPDGN